MARIGAEVVPILGIIDLCVMPHLRHEGRASAILDMATHIATERRAEFTMLFADDADLYLRSGYQPVNPAVVTWLAIEDRATYGVEERDFGGILLARAVAGKEFPKGTIDLLGYLF